MYDFIKHINLNKLYNIIHIVFIGSMLLIISTTLLATPVIAPEDKIKAAYIYQFTQFVTWPDTIESLESSINICILGNEPITHQLKPLHLSKPNNQVIHIQFLQNIGNESCNILYIAKTKSRNLNAILKKLGNRSILTISSIPDFAKKGGVIGFINVNNKVRIQINRKTAQRANLKISAKLLEVSTLVSSESTEEQH